MSVGGGPGARLEAARCGLSYLKAQLLKKKPEEDFETWVSNRFGKRLFQIFFKTYTEKVWGMPCKEIKAEWAAQRIKDLSLFTLVWNAIRPRRRQSAGAAADRAPGDAAAARMTGP